MPRESEAVMKLTLTIPTTVIGSKHVSRKDLCIMYGLCDPVWDNDREEKLDEIMKNWNPNNINNIIPRYNFGSFIKFRLAQYFSGIEHVTNFELPKIKIITIDKSNVDKLYNNTKAREKFLDELGCDAESELALKVMLHDYIESNSDEPLKFEVILKDTEMVVSAVSDGTIPVQILPDYVLKQMLER